MPQNFIEGSREQGFLLPPDVREWLAPDHLAWFVIGAVDGMDLGGFYLAYRADGHGRAAYEPSLMVTLILYAFATGVRSSRAIERHCRQDVAYRVITGNLVPDHATVARFIDRHQRALADLFGEVLRLCDEAGLVKPGVVSIDGTRIAGNSSPEVNHEFEQIAAEVIAKTRATDEAEDEEFGEARGDELPEQLRTPEGRREFFRRARERMRGEEQSLEPAGEPEAEASDQVPLRLEAQEIVRRGRQGRDAWFREGKRQLEQHRWENPDPISRSREQRLLLAAERLESELTITRNEVRRHAGIVLAAPDTTLYPTATSKAELPLCAAGVRPREQHAMAAPPSSRCARKQELMPTEVAPKLRRRGGAPRYGTATKSSRKALADAVSSR
jgi:transposase